MSAKVRAGVLPNILKALIQARAATRQLLKEATDPVLKSVLDGRQKAIKVRPTSAPCRAVSEIRQMPDLF